MVTLTSSLSPHLFTKESSSNEEGPVTINCSNPFARFRAKEVLIQTNIPKLLFLLIDLISQVEEWEMERETGFEPATSTLARLRSTSWAILAFAVKWINSIL